MKRSTIVESRFSKSAVGSLSITGILGDITIGNNEISKAVVRVSKSGEQYTVYYKAYSNIKPTIRNLFYFNTLDDALNYADEYSRLFLNNGFKQI